MKVKQKVESDNGELHCFAHSIMWLIGWKCFTIVHNGSYITNIKFNRLRSTNEIAAGEMSTYTNEITKHK